MLKPVNVISLVPSAWKTNVMVSPFKLNGLGFIVPVNWRVAVPEILLPKYTFT